MVGKTGFEPATLCSQSRCATKLRYFPIIPQTRYPVIISELALSGDLCFSRCGNCSMRGGVLSFAGHKPSVYTLKLD